MGSQSNYYFQKSISFLCTFLTNLFLVLSATKVRSETKQLMWHWHPRKFLRERGGANIIQLTKEAKIKKRIRNGQRAVHEFDNVNGVGGVITCVITWGRFLIQYFDPFAVPSNFFAPFCSTIVWRIVLGEFFLFG